MGCSVLIQVRYLLRAWNGEHFSNRIRWSYRSRSDSICASWKPKSPAGRLYARTKEVSKVANCDMDKTLCIASAVLSKAGDRLVPVRRRVQDDAFCNAVSGAVVQFARARQTKCFAPEWAIVNYVEKKLSKNDQLIFAADVILKY
jgi:hypothetical protein